MTSSYIAFFTINCKRTTTSQFNERIAFACPFSATPHGLLCDPGSVPRRLGRGHLSTRLGHPDRENTFRKSYSSNVKLRESETPKHERNSNTCATAIVYSHHVYSHRYSALSPYGDSPGCPGMPSFSPIRPPVMLQPWL